MDTEIIARLQGFGFNVWMREPGDTYLLFTDAEDKNIGYLQIGRLEGIGLSTRHKANTISGTGFQVQRHHTGELTREDCERCFVIAPGWADSRSRASVKKYRDMAEYLADSSFNAAYKLVPPVEVAA